ncbi:MAG: 5-formyltetrahydrofolate cyclo-ligase [Propionibacteriales bacterium]|nr:5-formyltetrahydrofolate cyclo-ligase [Propionibacteriales bacterium]
MVHDDVSAEKGALRRRLLSAREALTGPEISESGRALTALVLDQPELSGVRRVGLYVSVGAEPPTGSLLDSFHERGVEVLLPVLAENRRLDWALYAGRSTLAPARFGLLEPTGAREGIDAVCHADAVLCPGLAVDATGTRLGRGGGYYDGVLDRIGGRVWTCVLLYASEVLDVVPATSRDRRVHAAATPTGMTRFETPTTPRR